MFMYLHLYTSPNRSGNVVAKVRNTGYLGKPDIENSQSSSSTTPFAVFRIEEFTGLSCIDIDDIIAEIKNRLSTKQILRKLDMDLTNEDIIEILQERMM